MNHATGYVVFDYLVTALLWLAVILQAAVLRDRSICESTLAASCRWLVAAGIAGIALRFTFVLLDRGDIRLPPFSLASLALLAVGLIGNPLDKLMRAPRCRRATDQPEGVIQ